ncbi:MAG: response regulator, partial [Microcystaceae cyanobacterium]
SPSRSTSQREESKLQEQTQAGLAIAWEKYKGQNSDRVTILEQATTALYKNTLSGELQQKAQAAAHKLAGTLGVFGFTEGSRLAKEIEQILQSSVILDRPQAGHLAKLVLSLRKLLNRASSGQLSQSWVHHRCPVMVVVDDDAELAECIVKQSVTLEMRLERVPNLSAARNALTQPSLDVVLLDFAFANAAEDHLTLLAELINQTPPIPVLLFTIHDNLINRVKAAQLGVHAFFQKPQIPEQILETITHVIKQVCGTVAKVMVVDDDPQVLAVMRTLLEPWGIQLTTLEEPLQFWRILEEFSPDLLVLDLEMPHFTGIELCQAVRNDPRWCALPILFFTVHTNASTAY